MHFKFGKGPFTSCLLPKLFCNGRCPFCKAQGLLAGSSLEPIAAAPLLELTESQLYETENSAFEEVVIEAETAAEPEQEAAAVTTVSTGTDTETEKATESETETKKAAETKKDKEEMTQVGSASSDSSDDDLMSLDEQPDTEVVEVAEVVVEAMNAPTSSSTSSSSSAVVQSNKTKKRKTEEQKLWEDAKNSYDMEGKQSSLVFLVRLCLVY